MKKNLTEHALVWLCVGFLLLMLCAVGVRAFAGHVLVEGMGIQNRFTELVLSGTDAAPDRQEDAAAGEEIAIDWAEQYPFGEGEEAPASGKESKSPLEKYQKWVSTFKDDREADATELLPGYDRMTDAANRYERGLGWNYASYMEYNNVVTLENGYLAAFAREKDITEAFQSVTELDDWCKGLDIPFLYVQTPCKICKAEDAALSGTVDFSNQNADDLISRLNGVGIPTYDLREEMHRAGLNHHDSFYRTDHHWTGETAFWASGRILEHLRKSYGMETDPEILSRESFIEKTYPAWFLGSQGKKVTLAQTEPEDFTLLYPNFETRLRYTVPTRGLDVTGDFSVTYAMEHMEHTCEQDYYDKSPYHVYNNGDTALIQVENELISDNGKVLLIHDSFTDPMISFLSLGIKHLDAIDLRHFTGSLQTYIKETRPDLVLLIYNPNQIDPVDWTGHTSTFDFR